MLGMLQQGVQDPEEPEEEERREDQQHPVEEHNLALPGDEIIEHLLNARRSRWRIRR